MKSPEIVLSLNEIMFYFTRAAVGAGLSFGMAEDFGCSSIWIAVSGLDPARITSKTLKSLDEDQSSLCASQTEIGVKTVLTPSGGKQLSALFAGPSVCDWILEKEAVSDKTQHFVVEKVDHPFMLAAAVGALKSGNWEICWQDSGGTLSNVLTDQHGNWKTSLERNEIFKQHGPADVSIKSAESSLFSSKKWIDKTTYSKKNRQGVLESGVPLYEAWPTIHKLFSRCLVPSTEESHKSGAGAGLVDTD